MYALMSCLLLCGLGLGTVVRTLPTAGGGRPNWFFCKRAVVASMEWALAGLGVAAETTPTLASYAAAVQTSLAEPSPPRTPCIDWLTAVASSGEQVCHAESCMSHRGAFVFAVNVTLGGHRPSILGNAAST